MSSILEALKKVEKEANPYSDTYPSPPPETWNSGNHWLFSPKQKRSSFSILLGLVLIALLGGGIWNHMKHRERTVIEQQTFKDEQGRASVSNSRQPVKEKKLNSSPYLPVKNGKTISASGSEDPKPDNGKRVAGLEPSSPRPQPETSPAEADKEHDDPRPAKPKESVSRMSTPTAAPFEGLSQQKKSGFTLQALVWSQEAAECWAMVNGRSVRVGDFVNQAKVAHIGQGHIVFEKNGKRWKHPFQ